MEELKEKPKTPEQEWKDFMPPDTFVPEWKKQFQALDREQALKKTAERSLYAALGCVVATGLSFLSFIPHLRAIQLGVLGALILVALVTSYISLRNKLRAVEIDNKLNEDIRIEALKKEPDPQPVVSEQKA